MRDDDCEDRVWPARLTVHFCRGNCARLIAFNHQVVDLLKQKVCFMNTIMLVLNYIPYGGVNWGRGLSFLLLPPLNTQTNLDQLLSLKDSWFETIPFVQKRLSFIIRTVLKRNSNILCPKLDALINLMWLKAPEAKPIFRPADICGRNIGFATG